MTRHQNVLFILIDQMRADLLHGALAAHINLPNLRALMDDAVTFQTHYSVTTPCGPSRVSILTGQYAMNHRAVRNGSPLRHDTPNLALHARKAGYQPLLFGYTDTARDPRIHHAADPALQSYEMPISGFEEALEMRLERSYPWRADLLAKGYDLPDYARFYVPVSPSGHPARAPNDPAFYRAEDSDTAFLTNSCLSQLAARQGEEWFAHLTYIRPHPPLVAPAPYNDMYDPCRIPAPLRAVPGVPHPFLDIAARYRRPADCVAGFPDLDDSAETARTLRAIYFGLTTEVDHHIGRVIRFLRDTDQYDNTLIIIGADHGEMLGDFDTWGKMSIQNAAFHVPLIIRDPRHPSAHGTHVTQPTESIDIMPTLLDWIGAGIPASVNGTSLMPFLEGRTPDTWRTTSYSEIAFGDPVTPTLWQRELGLTDAAATLAILRSGRFTLVHFNGGLPPLLFDHTAQGEMANLADDPAHAADLLAMTQALLSHRMSNPDTTLSKTMITSGGAVTAGQA